MNILQKQVATAKATILVIGGLPSTKIQYFSNWNRIDYFTKDKWDYPVRNTVKLIPGNWQLLGFLKDIEEDVAKELVESRETIPNGIIYKDYSTFGWQTSNDITAIESLNSLIVANCKLKNKYGEMMPELEPVCCEVPITDRNGYPECCGIPIPTEGSIFLKRLWQEEQSKIFTNPFLLKKI